MGAPRALLVGFGMEQAPHEPLGPLWGGVSPDGLHMGPLGPGPWVQWNQGPWALAAGMDPGPWEKWTRALGAVDKGSGPWDQWTRAQDPGTSGP